VRIVVLGGAGDMGAETVRDLVKFSKAGEIVIADRNRRAAERLAASLNTDRVRAQEVDAASHSSLVKVMEGSQVTAGALGPFYRFERPIVEAALEAGSNYVSICDDHDAAESVFELDQEARQKGRRILTGLGWTPGLSNMMARLGYEELDKVDSINIYWSGSSGDSKGLAVVLHLIHIFTGQVTSFQNGEFVKVKAGSGKEAVSFPPPLDSINTFHLGHPEPLTLPRTLEGVNEVTLKGGLAKNYLNNLAKLLAGLGLTRNRLTKQALGQIIKILIPIFPTDKKKNFSGIRVDVSGTRLNAEKRLVYSAVANMRRLTAIPLSIGTIMMANNQISRFGVFSPEIEGAVDSKLFLQELEKRDIIVHQQEL